MGTMKPETCTSTESQSRAADAQSVVPRLLDPRSAGSYLGLSYWSLREMVLNGEIPHVRFRNKKILLDRQDLDKWIEAEKQCGVF